MTIVVVAGVWSEESFRAHDRILSCTGDGCPQRSTRIVGGYHEWSTWMTAWVAKCLRELFHLQLRLRKWMLNLHQVQPLEICGAKRWTYD